VACGCVRNFYMTEPMHALIKHSVDVWNYDPVALGFQQVGYVSCGEANQMEEYEKIHKNQNAVGYSSDLYQGKDARQFLSSIWSDFNHHSIDVVLHEKLSGYAGTAQAINETLQQPGPQHLKATLALEGVDLEKDSLLPSRQVWTLVGRLKLLDPSGRLTFEKSLRVIGKAEADEPDAPTVAEGSELAKKFAHRMTLELLTQLGEIQVSAIEGNQATIDAGKKDGIVPGTIFEAYAPHQATAKDPGPAKAKVKIIRVSWGVSSGDISENKGDRKFIVLANPEIIECDL